MKKAVITIIVSGLVYWILPVSITLYERPSSGQLKAAGEIVPAAPLEECVTIKNDGTQASPTGLQTLPVQLIDFEILLATYARNNTSHYTLSIYGLNAGHKQPISEFAINAADLKDNKYVGGSFVRPLNADQLCYSLHTGDATPGNAITAWLTATGRATDGNEPVLKLKSITNLQEAVKSIAQKNYFGLGAELLSGLFFVYLVSQTAIICVLTAYASRQIPKFKNRKRARRSRL